MQLTSTLLSLALVGSAVSQFQGLPSCATDCADKYLAGGIGDCGTDPKCICASKDFIADISCCVADTCNKSDQAQAIQFAQQICNANGVSVPTTAVCTATSAAPAGSTPTAGTKPTGTTPAATPAITSGAAEPTQASGSAPSGPAPSGTGNAAGPAATAAPVMAALGGLLAALALL
ncbi:hypothetical protein P8C59_006746 [Phyllachora maydis]|uniref:CFEM domain-containing protein n=1 Tax=Phyllachora maydis TaxID=1825666 RepID=A0AAD9MCU7_9PEZI|nr:hypothetical protein P8C59_006746 [Phyllachora maydis]